MRIDNWPLDRIMRLPDWCFGRRWWVGEYCGNVNGGAYQVVGTEELPDKFVVWGVLVSCMSPNCLQALRVTLRLADNLAAFTAAPLNYDRLLKGISIPTITYEFYANQNGVTWINAEREIVESGGKRLAIQTNGDQAILYEATVAILISALPKEVPDWLFSAQGKNL